MPGQPDRVLGIGPGAATPGRQIQLGAQFRRLIVHNSLRGHLKEGRESLLACTSHAEAGHSYPGLLLCRCTTAELKAKAQAAAARVSGASFNIPRSVSRNSGTFS